MIISIEGNGSRPSHKGDGYSMDESMYTLNSTEVHAVCYVIGSYASNAWKSRNPHSGIYKTEIAKTLDAINCGYPGCNQGGVAVVQAVDCRNGTLGDVNGTLQAKSNGGISLNLNNVVMIGHEDSES